MDDSGITCDEIIESYDEEAHVDVEAKSKNGTKSNNKTKTILTSFNEIKVTFKSKISIFY